MLDKIEKMISACAWTGGVFGFLAMCYMGLAGPLLIASPLGLLILPLGIIVSMIAGAILTPILYPILCVLGCIFGGIVYVFEFELFRRLVVLVISLIIIAAIFSIISMVIALIVVEWPQIINHEWLEIISFVEKIIKSFIIEFRRI